MEMNPDEKESRDPVKILVFYDENPHEPISTVTEEEPIPIPEAGEKVQLREAEGSEDPESFDLDLNIEEVGHYVVNEKWTSYTDAKYSTGDGIAEQLIVYVMIEVESVEAE